jgi:hypothetical protein
LNHAAALPSPADLGPDLHLLSLALRRDANPQERSALAGLIADGPDWPSVIEAARRHSVSSLILPVLQNCGAPVPREVLDGLRRRGVQTAGRGLAQVAEIVRLARAFRHAEIPMLVLKGAVLSEQLYGDPFLRSARDVDLIVASENFLAADTLLVAQGYRHVGRVYSGRELETYRRHIKEMEYVSDAAHVRVELHHRLTDNENLLNCDFPALLRSHDEILLAGAPVATLPGRMLPVYLCVHGASHGWQRLIWLADFAAALRGPSEIDAALAQAENFGLRPLMLHGLALSHLWLGTAVPAGDLRAAHATRQGRALDRVLTVLFSRSFLRGAPRTRAQRWRNIWLLRLYTYLAKLDRRYWQRQVCRDLISPADWDMVQLPDRLFWLYPLLRPFGWLLRRPRP